MEIRLGKPEDLEAMLEADPIAGRDQSRRSFLASSIQRGECWVADVSGAVCGFIVLEYSFFGNGFVPLVVVQESARRRGIGLRLLNHAASSCATPKLFTSTNESNTAMRSLLSRAGFRPSGVIHNLDPGDPELVYVRMGDLT